MTFNKRLQNRVVSGGIPKIVNIDLATASTEVSYTLSQGTRAFTLKLRNQGYSSRISLGTQSGQTGTTGTYITIPANSSFGQEGIFTKKDTKLFIQTDTVSQVAELLFWK